jgi:glucosamine--fructose-6-phosphate aminotransferase (isomerizing)
MCGIFGYLGERDAVVTAIEGLEKLEYRGYDSAGCATIQEDEILCIKEVGKIAALKDLLKQHKLKKNQIAIAHTRWATHGKPSQENAHPHFDDRQQLVVVHNGIIENYEAIKRLLTKRGITFRSETDTEVIAQLIGFLYKDDLLKAVKYSLPLLKGAFAIAVIHKNHPEEIICAANESPLAIGMGHKEVFVSSDAQAFLKYTRKVLYLREGEIARVTVEGCQVFNDHFIPISRELEELHQEIEEVSKGTYQHFMLKEIFEQPRTIKNALLSRYNLESYTSILEGLTLSDEELLQVKRIVIVACGSSYHAGLLAAYMIEEYARIPVEVHISSEFRYKNPIVSDSTLAIAISQSGETADTLAAMRELKAKGAKIVGICNVLGSTIAREVDSVLFLRAGPEIGVASTKAFTSQLVVIALFTLRMARMRMMSRNDGQLFVEALLQLPQQVDAILDKHKVIEALAEKYANYDNFFFLGRRYMYPTALEGALKLKEIAYINANGYPAGEMKHGPIALISPDCPTIAFCSDSLTFEKIVSNLMEIKARDGLILAISSEQNADLERIVDDIIYIPKTLDALAPLLSTVVGQLFAYDIAMCRKREIDQPRNLAKSVTVE